MRIWNKELEKIVGNTVNSDDECLKHVAYVLQQLLYCHTTDGSLTKGKRYYDF